MKERVCLREELFRRILYYLERHPSDIFARIEMQILLQATARAFGRRGICVLFSGNPLGKYADFTKDCMKTPADRKRLYRISFRLGRKIREIVGFRRPEDLQQLVFLLYRNIGITMMGEIPGEVLVSECFFSRVYTARECRCISAMDGGIIAGICGSGRLHFTERITEGCSHCRACVAEKRCKE